MAALTPLQQLAREGQSIWLDNIRRQLLTSGELAALRDAGVTGVTSNPTIFEKAVAGSTDYDDALVRETRRRRKPEQVLWDLMVEDIQDAADVFRPVYDRTAGADGYVSIEGSPVVARSTKRTIAIAQELWDRSARPNVMVKIPATRPGLPAITEMLGRGVNINVTLIFSIERYEAVVEAFFSGMEKLRDRGGDLSKVGSVASFFVSRVDSKVDKLLEALIAAEKDAGRRRELQQLLGHAAIDNSKVAYESWKRLHSGPRWKALEKAGARPQRCLWASTSTKNPAYPDTMYVEALVGPETVDTVPPATLDAIRDHAEVTRTLDADVDAARRRLARLAELGIDMEKVTAELEVEGVDAFAKSFNDLVETLSAKSKAIRAGQGPRQWYALGHAQPAVTETAHELQKADAVKRLWAKDATLWPGGKAQRKEIVERLGWLDVVGKMRADRRRLQTLAKQAAQDYDDVVLLGMGGSSLAPDVFRATFGAQPGHPRLHVLDTTDPATVLGVRGRIDPARTLFVVASKSGTTTETLSHFAYFWQEVAGAGVKKPGRNFLAVTDPGTSLEALAGERGFRWTFANPPDIGGRYSALSFFGLVPAALSGVDVELLLDRAGEMAKSCSGNETVEVNPGVYLGAVLGRLARDGRDKLTFIVTPRLRAFGYWVEQLVAESTGKEGKGIVPIEGEPLGEPAVYGSDRLFVHVRLDRDPEDARVQALIDAGQPVVTLTLRDKYDLAAEFMRWEVATAIAGSVLGIDAFDQPNVQESKDNTKKVLKEFEKAGRLPAEASVGARDAGAAIKRALKGGPRRPYVALMAYTARTAQSEKSIEGIRTAIRDRSGAATTSGYGPRFLHSTGQLHKGGPKEGVFVQVVQEDARDAAIPGEPYSFSTLKQAQAIGDAQALRSRGYPFVRVDLGRRSAEGWRQLWDSVDAAFGKESG